MILSNSLFTIHLDLPSIVSGGDIAFLDPHETHFGRTETGQQFSLEEQLLQEYPDQFMPYEDVLDCKISSLSYNGTLFRFPLRSEPSDLSKKKYTADKVRKLFDALKEEASVILLFLKNIEEIALFETDEDNIKKHLFTVKLSDSCRQEIRQKKKSLLTQVQLLSEGRVQSTNLSLTLSVEEIGEGGSVVDHKWLVYHQIDARDSGLRQLSSELGLLPWVGFATPLKASKRQALSSTGGRIFCFLPLPPDADSKTGFPVHVHGYFGLTDNRRGLKWPGPDCQNDPTAEWNVLLSTQVGSQAYASMLLDLADKQKAELVYQSWPNLQNVEKHWKDILKPMFSILMSGNVFWSPADGGKWVKPQDAYLDRMTVSNEVREVVLETLTQANEAIVTVPDHVLEAIDSMAWPTRSITPTYLRNLLKKKRKGSWDITNVPKKKKINLLEYVVQDKNLNDLQGVPLLPLANGSFVEFRSLQYNREPSAAVYVSSTRRSRSLFHNMGGKFLDDGIQSPALEYLSKAASDVENVQTTFPVQLFKLNKTVVLNLLRQILPAEWTRTDQFVCWYPGQNGHPPESWLALVWKWIQSDFPNDLSMLEGFPLIPHTNSGCRSIVKLRAPSLAIRQHHQGQSLPQPVASLLKKVGGIVLGNLPSYVNHAALHNYIASPIPGGVLKVLQVLGQGTCVSMISACCSIEEKRELRGFLSSTPLSVDQRCLLQYLPIFDAADRKSFVAIKEGFQTRTIAPYRFELPESLPVPNASSMISLRDDQSNALLQRLGISVMTPTNFLTSVVFRGITNGFYNHQQISTLMCWVLRQYHFIQDGSFHASLTQLPFVRTQSARLLTPCEVLDPQQHNLRQLFEGESDRFPHDDFAKDDILQTLRKLGMRSVPNAQDILHVATTVQNFDDSIASRKAQALLEFLDHNSTLLKSDRTLAQALMNERWIQRNKDRPPSYPRGMPWFSGNGRFFKPSEVWSQSKANLVGASVPLASKRCSNVLESVFGWNKAPSVLHVLSQLRASCCVPLNDMNGRERYQFEAMLKEIYQEASQNVESITSKIRDDPSFPEWIWHGNGFTTPPKIAFVLSCNIDLKPYLYTVPHDFQALRSFLQRCGVRQTFDESDLLKVLAMIKDKHDKKGAFVEDVANDQKLSRDILHWIVRDGKRLDSELRQNLLVPVMTWNKTLKLVPCSECTFCDATWLKKGGSELPITSQFPMIHDTISSKVATLLGVPPISTRVAGAEALGIEQTGPHEPITTRLKNILNEYKEGVGVFRELVQNADDAGATEVQFVLDWRNHPTESLLSPGMADCQGPALLVYNNAVFTDDDLKNISKLAGTTKREDLEKIGRFGLGFSSVYHFTDVPTFITRNYAVFFDPHTTHLEAHITNPSKPGIKLDLAINPANLMYFSDQFAPYNGMFGCDTLAPKHSDEFFFQGTLFRFAFRTKRGEISDKIYSKEEIQRLVCSFQESSPSLLLFTQHVKKLTFLEMEKNSIDPGNPQVLFEMWKETNNVHQPDDESRTETTFLESCAAWTRQTVGRSCTLEKASPPKRSELVSISSKMNSKDGTKSQENCSWLISSSLGIEQSFGLATSEEGKKQGLLSASGIAGRICSNNDKEGLFNPEAIPGEIFCFLPLSIPTGLPVHVNGYFAVTSNRRGIWESTTAEVGSHQPLEVRWNRSLMEDAVSQAYIQLLEDMILMQKQAKIPSYGSFTLWPNPETLKSSAWTTLVKSVYQRIATSDLPLVHMGGKWLPVTECIYQDANLQELPNSETVLAMLGYKVAQLPNFAKKGFKEAGCMRIIEERTMTQEKFLKDVFFPNIIKFPGDVRDPIVCYLIDQCLQGHASRQSDPLRSLYISLLSENRCIPCGPGEDDLAFPKELINPNGAAANLFTSNDKRFPVGTHYRTKERLLMFQNLGMVSDILDWGILLERAKTVPELCRRKADKDARERVACVVKYINEYLPKLESPTKAMNTELRKVCMFPVLRKPANYTMPWKGFSNHQNGIGMVSSEEMYGEEYKFVAGSSRPILDESESLGCGKLGDGTRNLFGFDGRTPTVQEALGQLDQAIQTTIKTTDEAHCLQEVSQCIYGYLQELLSKPDCEIIVEELVDRSWILIQGNFVSSSQLAFRWKGAGEPYLYKVPTTLAEKYRRLFQATGVRDTFSKEDIVRTLYKISEEKLWKPLTTEEFKVTRSLIDELLEVPESVLRKKNGLIPLPDHNLILHPAKELAINDAPWVTPRDHTAYVHKYVPIDLAYKMGAVDIRSKKLAKISRPIGKPFGQREELTDRLKGILKSYPCDVGILKELVQNADDAGATEIHFIYDPRNHPTNRLLSDNWKELQGPALCVYNNQPFSDKDLEGIQRLGIGSKTEDPTKTGQYGIGFNAVYHLTDCPSFISNGDTLCVLDPHCRYVPGATEVFPGRLIEPIEEEERSDYRDVFPCYLEDLFDLKSATMFRFPLRNTKMSAESLISEEQVSHEQMTSFMNMFTIEAKEILLFLNHLKKITLSKIEEGKLREMYSVSAQLTDEDAAQRVKLSDHIKNSKALETNEIEWFGITYPLLVRDTLREETWLIHQCVGIKGSVGDEEVPDGRKYGLLPRGGVAAKLSEKTKFPSLHEPKHRAFCFLPLPLCTGLPVHVNGHFFLDSARRNLWRDENDKGFGSTWNRFIMTKVLAQAYVSLLLVARRFLPGSKKSEVVCFSKEYLLHRGMRWYHQLFPSIQCVKSQWKILASAVFQTICSENEKLLPMTKKAYIDTSPLRQSPGETASSELTQCFWLAPSEAVFNNLAFDKTDDQFRTTLLKAGFKLLYPSYSLYEDFTNAGTHVTQMTPEVVIQFLKDPSTNVGSLPSPVSNTAVGSVEGVLCILSYCMKDPKFATHIFGLPLLLTEGEVLKRFQKKEPVFLSLFADLVPKKHSLFLHHTLTKPLLHIEDEIFAADQGVLKKFDIGALASLLPSTENASWCETNNLVAWVVNDGPSKKWLQRLWEFIFKIHRKDPKTFSLDPLSKWPILPTQSGMLAPVSKGKVILDLSTSESWSPGQKNVVELLRKLKCHEVDSRLISSDGRWDVSPILKLHLARPNSSEDILKVLDHLMKETDISGSLSREEMISILLFLQDDVNSLKRNGVSSSIVKRLPFFKTFHGTFVSLENVQSIYVVPTGLPTEESDVWMTGNNCVFLAPEPRLDRLYRELLGAGDKTHTDCYINFIFPKFPNLKQATRMLHLNHVRRFLLAPYVNESQRPRIINSLRSLAFIPYASGTPRTASHFYDPGVKVFAVMLPPDSKPPKPFDQESGWLDLLREIGLKKEVSKDQFITFANDVATQAVHANKSSRPGLEEKSEALVKHLLKEKSLHDENYLRNLSTVKFVAPQKASDELVHLHRQHLVESGNQAQLPPFSQFKNSIPHTHERLVWTTAPLLPSWAVPVSKFPKLAKLQVLQKPTLDQVIENVSNLSKSLSKRTDREQPEPRRRILSQIMTEVYTFLTEMSECSTSASLESCSPVCVTIGRRLSSVSCILVEGGRVFVRCDQLAYDLDEQLPPYLYRVPREYGAFEHLFKRLGAMEKATPVQFATLLNRLKESSGDEKMHANEVVVAKQAVFGLFSTLYAIQKRDGDASKSCQDHPLAEIKTLYLPSRGLKLQRSTDLVLFDCPQYTRRISDTMYEFLDRLDKYNLNFATHEQLVDLLPVHLKTRSLASLVREELHPDCKDRKCQADMERKCQATELLRQIVFSPQLVDGILRILKFQFQKAKLTEQVRNNVRSFQKELGMSCMEVLSTELVENVSNAPIPDSQRTKWRDCFVGEENGKKHIFIKHGVEPSNIRRVLCREINDLTGCYIDSDSWLHLSAILECKNPQDISSTLDNAGVTQDVEAGETPQLEPELGSEFPEELHYLLEQYADFYFWQGEFVAFETEDSTDEEPKYIYAKIMYRIKTPQPAKPKKDRTKRKQKGENNLLSRYLIDIGNEKKEVDVLDLYKIRRPQQNHEEENGMENELVSESMELVLYTGEAGQSEQPRAQPSTSSQGATEPPKPRTLDNALKEVRKALAEIWKLPEDKRKKALRRLYLRWHPDKNMDMQHIANEVMKFIQNEVERLSRRREDEKREDEKREKPDFSDFFRHWHQRARRQRSSYENFRRHNPRFTGFASSSRRRYTGRDARLSKIWMSQSREDLRSVKYLLAARDPLYYLMCFQCHQVAEKALKAALYALSGVADSQLGSHDLVKLACDLSLLTGAPDVTSLVARLSNYYDATRYPNKHVPARAPGDVFQDSQQAQEAFRVATDVVTRLEQHLRL